MLRSLFGTGTVLSMHKDRREQATATGYFPA